MPGRFRCLLVPILLCAIAPASIAWPVLAGDRVPGEHWMRFADVTEAGFDRTRLLAAKELWEEMPSAAFMVIADGAVVASWGDVDRRFMCHSVRKSFLSALYGIYWDRGEIELNKTMAELGIDDEPDPLLDIEKQARILDLLKARSGVFHPAAYAGRTDSRPRGSEGPGQYFAYNNWDFNTLATILEQQTDERVFEAFDQYFGRPLGMEDWRISDGYYHYERDKSKYPAYPFRMSARDAARFGLLFARNGEWADQSILSENWVRRSSAMYSIDSDVMGYGFMWWVLREPRFEKHGMFSALGVGNQMIAALPKSDIVIVNRANTYEGLGTPMPALLDLIEQVLDSRLGGPAQNPRLVPLESEPDPLMTRVSQESLREFVGDWTFPAPALGLPPDTTVRITLEDGHLIGFSPVSGTFQLHVQPDGSWHEEDSYERYYPVRDATGAFDGVSDAGTIAAAALQVVAAGDKERAEALMLLAKGDQGHFPMVTKSIIKLIAGDAQRAEQELRALAEKIPPARVETLINRIGYRLLQDQHPTPALRVFELNTRVFPKAFNAWDSLGEAHMSLGHDEEAIRCYEKSLELNEENENATQMIAKIKAGRS